MVYLWTLTSLKDWWFLIDWLRKLWNSHYREIKLNRYLNFEVSTENWTKNKELLLTISCRGLKLLKSRDTSSFLGGISHNIRSRRSLTTNSPSLTLNKCLSGFAKTWQMGGGGGSGSGSIGGATFQQQSLQLCTRETCWNSHWNSEGRIVLVTFESQWKWRKNPREKRS